jgi:hypothetical protein
MTFCRIKACLVSAAWIALAWSASAELVVKNIVLVHGAFVDGSGWQPVYEILVRDGYHVTVVQETYRIRPK